MSIQWNKELYHYGMPRRSGRYKWGSGKNPFHHGADDGSKHADKKAAKAKQKQDKKEAKAAKRAERKAELEKTIALNDYRRTWTEPYNAASEKFNRDIHAINEKYKDEKFDDEFKTDAGQRYVREVSAMWKKHYDEELQKRYGKYGDALNLENALMRNQYDEFIIPGYFDKKKKTISHSVKQNERHKMSIQWNKELYHYGISRRSGRYKWGSGEDPYHHGASIPRLKKGASSKVAKSVTYKFRSSVGNQREQFKAGKEALSNSKGGRDAVVKTAKSLSYPTRNSWKKQVDALNDNAERGSVEKVARSLSYPWRSAVKTQKEQMSRARSELFESNPSHNGSKNGENSKKVSGSDKKQSLNEKRLRSALNAQNRDIESLRKAGYHEEAKGLEKVRDKTSAKLERKYGENSKKVRRGKKKLAKYR